MSSDPYDWIDQSLNTIHRADWYRSVQTIQGLPGPVVLLEGRSVINFASNDYLGLAGDNRLVQAAVNATEQFGTGSTGSRLLSGHRELHRQLERAIALLKKTEDALVFSSGYLANLGVIPALVGKRDLILADQYNHSCLKNGAVLSGATVINYSHNDVEVVRNQLQKQRDRYRRCLIITDGVFSMDGDLCPLPALINLAQQFNCMMLVDDAHATGVLGTTGAGSAEHFGCIGQPLVQVGTFSKALGSLGGYVAGTAALIDFLRNRAASWIYTTALSPADTAAALTAVNIVQQEPERRLRLKQNVNTVKQLIAQRPPHLKLLPSESPILCLGLESAADAIDLWQRLKAAGIFAPAIRPPTVPTSRIRISVMATHELAHMQQLVEALACVVPNGSS